MVTRKTSQLPVNRTLDQELIQWLSLLDRIVVVVVVVLLLLLLGATLFKKDQGSVVSNRIGMKFDRIVLRVNAHRLRSRISGMTSYFQDGGLPVSPALAAAHAAVSVGCQLARRARMTSSSLNMCWSS